MAKIPVACSVGTHLQLSGIDFALSVDVSPLQKQQNLPSLPKDEIRNYVQEIYAPFSDAEISAKISELLTPKSINTKVDIIFQTVENLHKACPNNLGDWYFTGNYPTSGGNRVVNKAFINWKEGKNQRAY